jgi:hypothetical protein
MGISFENPPLVELIAELRWGTPNLPQAPPSGLLGDACRDGRSETAAPRLGRQRRQGDLLRQHRQQRLHPWQGTPLGAQLVGVYRWRELQRSTIFPVSLSMCNAHRGRRGQNPGGELRDWESLHWFDSMKNGLLALTNWVHGCSISLRRNCVRRNLVGEIARVVASTATSSLKAIS